MKTKNNVQKAILRSIALFVSLVLLSLTVTAQGYWKQLFVNNSFNHLASALVENPSSHDLKGENTSNIHYSDYFYNEVEEEMELEPWMTSFKEEMNSISDNVFEPVIELEDWMFDEGSFETANVQEEPLVLESWMTKEAI